MMKRAHILFAGVVIIFGSQALARTQIASEKINGYEVQFIHSADSSDEFQAGFEVALGSLSEGKEFIGRAKILQKFIASKLPLGASTFTGMGATSYSLEGRTQNAQGILRVLLTPLRKLDWDPDTFLAVRELVKREAEGRVPIDEFEKMIAMMYGLLLPAKHAWAPSPLGNPDAIAKLKFEGMRDYYLANYVPQNIKVTMRGNFADAAFLDAARLWSHEVLSQEHSGPRGSKLEPLSPRWAQSLFASPNAPTESERRLYVASANERYGLTVMEGDLKDFPDYSVVERLVERLNAQPRSGQSFFHLERIGNKAHLAFVATLRAGDSVQAINTEAFRQLRAEQLIGSPNAAQLFHPARALYAESGPGDEEMHRNERWNREYKLIDNRAAVRDYSKLFAPCEARLRLRGFSGEIGG